VLARLERKLDNTLTEYFRAFYHMCLKVCHRFAAEEDGKFLLCVFSLSRYANEVGGNCTCITRAAGKSSARFFGHIACTLYADAAGCYRCCTYCGLCVLGTTMSCAKTAEPIYMCFGGLDLCGPREPCIIWGFEEFLAHWKALGLSTR